MKNELNGFAIALLFIIIAIILVVLGLFVSSLLQPKRPNKEKLSTYECGEDTQGLAWGQFNVRFYVIALIFILFEVEIIFLYPWAVVFGQKKLLQTTPLWGWFALAEMFIFTFFLIIGLIYAWAKGYLDWVKPKPQPEPLDTIVPMDLYEKINQKY